MVIQRRNSREIALFFGRRVDILIVNNRWKTGMNGSGDGMWTVVLKEGRYGMADERNAFPKERAIKYVLLNKDIVIAEFEVDVLFDTITITEQFVELPEWFANLDNFIENRRAPKQRENIKELLRLSGCDTIQGFLDISHALSLIDTFWVKRADSDLCWKNVSLYSHPFSEVIAKTAFEGGLHGRQLSTTSPEYGTDGSFAKCWIREGEQIRLLKRGSSGARNAGLEPYSEFYAGQLIKYFTDDFVTYDLRIRNGKICSVCDLFTSEDYGFLPYAAVEPRNSSIKSVLNNMAEFGLEEKVKRMFVIDAVILNEDRHKNNFGFIVDNRTQKIVDMAPLFDHNVALLPYAEEGEFEYGGEYLRQKGPRLGDSWIKTAAMCLDSKTRKSLVRLSDFRFERHSKYNLPDWRLKDLERLIQKTIQKILSFPD